MKLFAVTLAVVMTITSPCLFADAAAKAEMLCAQWAKEDGVKSDEMEQYMIDCIADQKAAIEANPPVEEDAPKD